jgi:hypothetical protein
MYIILRHLIYMYKLLFVQTHDILLIIKQTYRRLKMKPSYSTVDWQDIKHKIRPINLKLFDIIEEISPKLPIKLVKYPYGMKISDPDLYYVPTGSGLDAFNASDYPYFLSLDKNLESYIEYGDAIVPGQVYTPGTFFPVNQEMSKYPKFNTRPGSLFSLMAGLRNISMMPLNQKNDSYYDLVRKFNIDARLSPGNIRDHQEILASIIKEHDTNWHASILIFDEEWKKNIQTNKKWFPLYQYILEQSIRINSAKRNIFYLDYMLFDITKKLRLRIKPFTINAIKQLLLIAIGDIPGFRPAMDDSGAPIKIITETFNTEYEPLNTPIIIEPHTYNPAEPVGPLYHSLFASDFNTNEQKTFRPLKYLAEISDYLDIYLNEFKDHLYSKNSIYGRLADIMMCRYYSSLGSSGNIEETERLQKYDPRFQSLHEKHKLTSRSGLFKRSLFTKALVSFELDTSKL